MIDDIRYPRKLLITADYGGAYVWHKGSGSLTGYFEDHPCYKELEGLDKIFSEWADWFWESVDEKKYGPFNWDEFHEKGLQLTKQLCEILSATKVQVTYRPPVEDPIRGLDKAVVMLDKLDE